jgi:hypothetical protein
VANAEAPDVRFSLWTTDDREVGSGSMSARPFDGDETEAAWVGARVYPEYFELDDGVNRGQLPLVLRVEVTEACGTTVTDAVPAFVRNW